MWNYGHTMHRDSRRRTEQKLKMFGFFHPVFPPVLGGNIWEILPLNQNVGPPKQNL